VFTNTQILALRREGEGLGAPFARIFLANAFGALPRQKKVSSVCRWVGSGLSRISPGKAITSKVVLNSGKHKLPRPHSASLMANRKPNP
jgi:hypothetical protein